MSMAVAPFIPKSMPILVGTQEILKAEQEFGRTLAALLEPPVDLDANNPSVDVAERNSGLRGASSQGPTRWFLSPGWQRS